MEDITKLLPVLQVTFSVWVAYYLITKTTAAVTDLVKQQAIIFTLLGEIKIDLDRLWDRYRVERGEVDKSA